MTVIVPGERIPGDRSYSHIRLKQLIPDIDCLADSLLSDTKAITAAPLRDGWQSINDGKLSNCLRTTDGAAIMLKHARQPGRPS